MFGNNKNGHERLDTHLETVIGSESSFQGTLRSKGSVRIDGKIEGGVSAEGVILGERGEVQGDISARTVVIGGKVTGDEVRHHDTLLLALVGEHRPAHHVADRPDVGHAGSAMIVDLNKAARIELNARAVRQ